MQTQEVPSVKYPRKKRKEVEDRFSKLLSEAPNQYEAKQVLLKMAVRKNFDYILYHDYLNREALCGAIGDRGGGKSATSATWGHINFQLDCKPVWSNMLIKFAYLVGDKCAREATGGYLKKGGFVFYQSEPLDKTALLKLDETYRDGCLVIEEINVEYSNARRFMTNTNVDFNEVCQQLRKFKVSMAFNVIDEMFVDSQLRALTDFFIKTYDTAFEINNMMHQTEVGNDFSWRIYPMTGYLAGEENKYSVKKKPLPPAIFHFTNLHGLFDSTKWQEKGIYSRSRTESSKEIQQAMDEWGWLAEKAMSIKDAGYEVIEPGELPYLIGRPITKPIREMLSVWGILWDNTNQVYSLERFTLSPPPLD